MELVEGLTLRHYLSMNADELSGNLLRPRPQIEHPTLSEDGEDEEEEEEGDEKKPFNLSAFSEEAPSEEISAVGYASGAAALRALADEADEPDTETLGDFELPYEVSGPKPGPREPAPRQEALRLNHPERVGRLKDALLQLCQALAYIHGHGLVHRDLKPSNVMVDQDRLVRLMDFGLAKFLADDAAVSVSGRLVGTFRYMAPEQILGETLDARADLYSLGVILYELLTGKAPFDAKTPYDLWQKVLETDPLPVQKLNPKVDEQLARIAHRLIRKEPSERFQTAEEIFEALSE
jgi:hypothetical protein